MGRLLTLVLAVCLAFFHPLDCAASSPESNDTYIPWVQACKNKIQGVLGEDFPKQFSREKYFSCTFRIDKDGYPYEYVLGRSTGDAAMDELVLSRVLSAAPYPVCPDPGVDTLGLTLLERVSVAWYYNSDSTLDYANKYSRKILSGYEQVLLDKQELRKFYFPFQSCVVAKLVSIRVEEAEKFSRAQIRAEVLKVVRGVCNQGDVIFELHAPQNELQKTLKQLEGHREQVVLAYNLAAGESGLNTAARYHIESPHILASAKQISDEDLAIAVGPIEKEIYPFSHCIMVTIENTEEEDDRVKVEFALDALLLGDAQSMSGVKGFWVNKGLLSEVSISELKGRQCVLELKGVHSELDYRNCRCTFARPRFSEEQIGFVKNKMKLMQENESKRRAALVSMLRKRWPVKNIGFFCKKENRWINDYDWLKCPDNGELWSGALYPNQTCSVKHNCAVFWQTAVRDGVPIKFQITVIPPDYSRREVVKNAGAWVIDSGTCPPPNSITLSKEEFAILSTSQVLWDVASSYRGPGADRLDMQWNRRKLESVKFEPTRPGEHANYSCILGDGSKLAAVLLPDGTVKSILINNQVDKPWNKALKQVNENLDFVNYVGARKLEIERRKRKAR